MNEEQSSLRLSMQMLASEMQTLSQSFKQATSNIQQTSAGMLRQVSASGRGAQGYATAAMAPLSQPRSPYQPGFSGMPTSIQYSSGALATINGGRDSWWRNAFTSAGNNEFNKPSNWWRDTLALAGKDFVDVSSEDAKRRAKRNWGIRVQDLAHSGVSTALAFVPGVGLPLSLGYEFLAKPALMEKSRRTNEYWDWYEKTGNRNVGARWSRSYDGGWTDSEQKELAARTQSAFKGSGFKKSQFDEMMSMAEQSGYFKTYERTTVDQQVTKVKKMMSDAKYVMQSLHTTAEEAVKILGDVEKMGNKGGKVNTHSYVSQLNRASAYSGLSPMQLHEYSVGRSEFFKGMGYSSRGATEMTAQQITQYYSDLTPGKKDNIEAHLSMEDRLSAMANKSDMVKFASLYAYDYGDNGLVFNEEKFRKMARGEISASKMVESATSIMNKIEKKDKNLLSLISSPGVMQNMLSADAEESNIPTSITENAKQRQMMQELLLRYNVTSTPENFTWKDYSLLSKEIKRGIETRVAEDLGGNPNDARELIKQLIGPGVNVGREEENARKLALGLPPKNLGISFKAEDFWSQQEQMLARDNLKPPEGWDPFVRAQSSRQKVIAQREADYLKTMSSADADISADDNEKILSAIKKASKKKEPHAYISQRIEKYQKDNRYDLAYRLAEEAQQDGMGDISSFLARGELTASQTSQATKQLLGGFDVERIRQTYRPAFLNSVGEYAKAISEGDARLLSDAEKNFRRTAKSYVKGDGEIDYLLESMRKGIVKKDGRTQIEGRGSEIYSFSAYLRSLGIKDKDQDGVESNMSTISIDDVNAKQQTDINQTILSYMDKQVKAMEAIARRLDK